MEEVHSSIATRRYLMNHLSTMSRTHCKKQELSHSALKNIDQLFRPELGAHPLAYHFLVDELITLIERPAL